MYSKGEITGWEAGVGQEHLGTVVVVRGFRRVRVVCAPFLGVCMRVCGCVCVYILVVSVIINVLVFVWW